MAQVDFNDIQALTAASSPITKSYAHTGGAILVRCMWGAGAGKRTVTAITFNGVAPDEVLVDNATGSNAEICVHSVVWYNVAAVTANLVVTLSAGGVYGAVRICSVTGHDTADAIQAATLFTAGAGTSYSNALAATLADSSLVVDMIGVLGDRAASISEDVGQTEIGSPNFNTAWVTSAESYEVGTGTVTMGWSWTGSDARNHVLVAFNNASGGVVHTETLDDSLQVGDSGIAGTLRNRLSSDSIILFDEEGVFRFHEYIVDDSVDAVSDQILAGVLRTRVTDDGLTLIDLLASAISSGSALYDYTLSDALSVSDGTLRTILRNRLTEDQMELVDHLFKALEKLRDVNVEILDEGIASVLRDATYTYDLNILFGSAPSGIVFGGYN
jgi:hypothetical protein